MIGCATGFYATIGCHPTRSAQFDKFKGGPSAYLEALDTLIEKNLKGKGRVVAVGECGLGTTFELFPSPGPNCECKTTIGRTLPIQKPRRGTSVSLFDRSSMLIFYAKHGIGSQLGLAKKYHLPLFLHSRAAHQDFVKILRDEGFGENGGKAVGGNGGVVHSFTGAAEEVVELVCTAYSSALRLRPEQISRYKWDSTSGAVVVTEPSFRTDHIRSVNGCSMKTEANLAAVRKIPPGKIMFETGRFIPGPRPV